MINKNRKEKMQFIEIKDKIEKCFKYTEITPNFLLDAYVLAKEIQQKYEYKILGKKEIEQIFKELGITVHVTEFEEKRETDSCTVTLIEDEIQICIKYYIPIHVRHFFDMSSGIWFDERIIGNNNSTFIYFYALVIIIMFYEKLEEGKSVQFNYETDKYNINEEIAINVALFLIYIKYDYEYRITRYPNVKDGKVIRELTNEHPYFYNQYAIPYYTSTILGKGKNTNIQDLYITTELERYLGHEKDCLTKSTLDRMLRNVEIIETTFKEKYFKLSTMLAPESLYSEWKDMDYTKFGEMRKIDF